MSFTGSFLGADEPDAVKGSVSWVAAGFTLFAFASPSAVQSAPFFIGGTGIGAGILIAIINTLGAVAGSWMLLQVKLKHPSAHNFGELGDKVMGAPGRIVGNILQLGNFLIFLPCALLFTGEAFAGIGKGITAFTQASGAPCWDYYIFVVAGICFMTTQLRTLSNTSIFSMISCFSVFMMAVIQIVAASHYELEGEKQPTRWFGNDGPNSFVLFSRAASICVFGYVPSFLTAELASCMTDPSEMTKSLVLSGWLNVIMMLGVGIYVCSQWGYNMGYVVGLTGQFAGPGTAQVRAWDAGNTANTVLNLFALAGNFVSYMLDSVPLGRYCQRKWAPRFRDTWSVGDISKYLMYTLPAFLFGLACAVFFPSLDFLIGAVTFLTTPWVTMVYPSILFWKAFKADLTTPEKLGVVVVFLIGIAGFVVSFIASVGDLVINGTKEWQIGCDGWVIMAKQPDGFVA